MRKIQTSINLTPEMKHIVDTEGLNLSAFTESQLEKYFSVSTIEDVNEKISEHKVAIAALDKKRIDLLEKGVSATHDSASAEVAEKELKEIYQKRRKDTDDLSLDRIWLGAPVNVLRLKAVGWQQDEALHNLRVWYDGL